jgi:hypothetical protein
MRDARSGPRNEEIRTMNARKIYPIGKKISWPHPSGSGQAVVTVACHEVDDHRTKLIVAVRVTGEDFIDSATVGRLEVDGSGLK